MDFSRGGSRGWEGTGVQLPVRRGFGPATLGCAADAFEAVAQGGESIHAKPLVGATRLGKRLL